MNSYPRSTTFSNHEPGHLKTIKLKPHLAGRGYIEIISEVEHHASGKLGRLIHMNKS